MMPLTVAAGRPGWRGRCRCRVPWFWISRFMLRGHYLRLSQTHPTLAPRLPAIAIRTMRREVQRIGTEPATPRQATRAHDGPTQPTQGNQNNQRTTDFTSSFLATLSPRASDLMYEQTKALQEGKVVQKPIYNHVTGVFDAAEEIKSPKVGPGRRCSPPPPLLPLLVLLLLSSSSPPSSSCPHLFFLRILLLLLLLYLKRRGFKLRWLTRRAILTGRTPRCSSWRASTPLLTSASVTCSTSRSTLTSPTVRPGALVPFPSPFQLDQHQAREEDPTSV